MIPFDTALAIGCFLFAASLTTLGWYVAARDGLHTRLAVGAFFVMQAVALLFVLRGIGLLMGQ